jgi:Fe-S oxidoreductase
LYRQETGGDLPFTVTDITEILNEKIHEMDFRTDRSIRAVFHLPCHHAKGQVLLQNLLENKKIPGIEMIEGTDRCCGGMTASSNPSAAYQMSTKIVETAAGRQADILATACIFCRDNLMRAARRNKSKLKVENILFLLAKNLSRGDMLNE